MVFAVVYVAGDRELLILGLVKRRAATAGDEVADSIAQGAVKEMVVTAKALIKEHYDKPLVRSVMAQVGGEGMMGLSAAQRFPEDYDFINSTNVITGFSRGTVWQLWVWMATHDTEPVSFRPRQLCPESVDAKSPP